MLAAVLTAGCGQRLVLGEALYGAAAEGNVARVQQLIRQGADVNYRFDDNEPPLMPAVTNNHEEVVRILLKAGARADAKSAFGESVLDRAPKGSAIRKLLEESIAKQSALADPAPQKQR